MTSVPDHGGKLIHQATDDKSKSLRHEPVRKSPEDAKRGGQRTGAGSRLTEVTDRGPASRRKQTGNAKPSRGRQPMPDNDMDQFDSEDL
jgi:hypothetical protein